MAEYKTEKELEAARRRRAALRRRRQIQRRNRMIATSALIAAIVLILLVIAVVTLKGCGKGDEESKPAPVKTEAQTPEAQTEAPETGTEPAETQTPESEVIPPESETAPETSAPETQPDNPSGIQPGNPNAMSMHELHQGQWDLAALDNENVPFGYSNNRDDRNIPTDWGYYEKLWGEFNVDWIQDTSSNMIYLTMDDGFPNPSTEPILDVLQQKNVKALFFVTKTFLDGSPETVKRMIDDGHQVGNHTCTHRNMPSLGIEEETKEIMTLQNALTEQFGYTPKYFRYPQGGYSKQSLGLVENLGLKAVFWSYAYNDYSDEQPPVAESLEKALNALHPGAIYLLHASSSTNAAFLADFIDGARARGFEFGVYPSNPN